MLLRGVECTMQTQVRTNTSRVVARRGGLYRRFFKRPMDCTLSLIALIILSPVFVAVASLVRLKLGTPVIFKQKRPGLNEKIFIMYKFRTMTDERDENGELLPDSVRLTKFGRLLRSTSLDELPELFNVLKDDMRRGYTNEILHIVDGITKNTSQILYIVVGGKNPQTQ